MGRVGIHPRTLPDASHLHRLMYHFMSGLTHIQVPVRILLGLYLLSLSPLRAVAGIPLLLKGAKRICQEHGRPSKYSWAWQEERSGIFKGG